MSSVMIFLLLFLLWSIGLYYQLKGYDKKVGLATAASKILRGLLNYPLCSGEELNGQHLRMVLIVKGGRLLLFSLLIRVIIFPRLWETVLLIIILVAVSLALYYLASLRNDPNEYQSVYPLSEDFGVYELLLSPSGTTGEWIGATLAELDLRKKELLVLSISRSGKITIFPKGPEILLADDRLLVFGKNATLPLKTLDGEKKC